MLLEGERLAVFRLEQGVAPIFYIILRIYHHRISYSHYPLTSTYYSIYVRTTYTSFCRLSFESLTPTKSSVNNLPPIFKGQTNALESVVLEEPLGALLKCVMRQLEGTWA